MKKILFVAAALTLMCSPLVRAQVKLDVDGLKAKAAKSDADIANAKKNAKAATWLDRGKTMLEIADAPTLGAYAGMDEKSADMMFGKGTAKTEKIGDKSYRAKSYPNITTYMTKEGEVYKVQFWMSKTEIIADPLGQATEAYMKAYSIDAGSAGKVRDGQNSVGNKYKEMANNYISLQKYPEAAGMLAKAFDVQLAPPLAVVDTLVGFNAGFLYTAANNFTEGEKYLTK
ncbi:MAG: hypothetical protein LBU95_04795, partial [Rikenellaceae bacterium]|nr:hypothetical protein [Rikenellaceae bacterium]